MDFKTYSSKETFDLGAKIAKEYKKKGGIITLIGPLGAGKTTFVQGFAKWLGIKEKIISPTFVLIRQHKIPDSDRFLFHIDLYRLEKKIKMKELGIDELNDGKNILLIEWGEKIIDLEKLNNIDLKIDLISDSQRVIHLN